ncbi:MAG: right-handed parallel beta-helix repeat-containing protein [Myxococcota bacterium]|nr:right-handed parallel beta-helix repeat-containing protein [Myxococcota bacterium]
MCRPDGACEAIENILYVSPEGVSAGQCPQTAPCEIHFAKDLANSEKSTIRLGNGTYLMSSDFIVGVATPHLSIVGGRGAVIERTAPGFALRVVDSSLTIRGITLHKGVECDRGSLELVRVVFDSPPSEARPWISTVNGCTSTLTESDLNDSTSDGIVVTTGSLTATKSAIRRSAGHGIRIESNATSQITDSVIADNRMLGVSAIISRLGVHRSLVFGNRAGGLSSIGGTYDVTNNFVSRNGNNASAAFGGMRLESTQAGNRAAHNTIVDNNCDVNATPVLSGGFFCTGGSAPNNLILDNSRGNASLENAQTGGTCNFGGSLIAESALGFFVSLGSLTPADYHLVAPNAAVNGGVTGNITDDIDGQARSDGMPDIGADELDL